MKYLREEQNGANYLQLQSTRSIPSAFLLGGQETNCQTKINPSAQTLRFKYNFLFVYLTFAVTYYRSRLRPRIVFCYRNYTILGVVFGSTHPHNRGMENFRITPRNFRHITAMRNVLLITRRDTI